VTDSELLTLAEREAQRLTDDNDHGAAIIMRELMERLRQANDAVQAARDDVQAGSFRRSVVASYIPA